jgi:hypothetical protein
MKQIIVKVLVVFCVYFTSSNAYPSLIINGGFEDTAVRKGGWKWFNASQVNGWMGSNIEIWNNLNGLEAAEGSQHIELNSHGHNMGPFSIYQDFSTTVGQSYSLKFHYRARRNKNEAFKVELLTPSDSAFSSHILDDHQVGFWAFYADSFTANSDKMRLQFTSIKPSTSTVGNFIDNIIISPQQLSSRAQIPEPSIFILVTLSIIGLLFANRRKR